MRLSKSFKGKVFLAAIYLQTFAFWEQGYRRRPTCTHKATLEV